MGKLQDTGVPPSGSGRSGLLPEPASRLGHSETVPNAEAIRSAIQARYAALIDRRAELQEELASTEPLMRACRAAASLFGFELPPAPGAANATTVASIVERLIAATGESGATVAELRPDVVAAYGAEIHQKSIGVALYRMAKAGAVRRVGRRWFAAQAIPSRRAETPQSDSGGTEGGAVPSGMRPNNSRGQQ